MVGELIAGRYELEELTGSGGMSRVYRARDLQLERLVAIKILHDSYADDPGYVERFRREARAVARLSHPHIVTVIDRGESDGRQYIVFEHVAGENLKQLVERVGPLPVSRALGIAIEVADALAFAHANGVVHRDVKPQNVLVPDGGAKVTDFGIARAEDPELLDEMTTTGTVLGTGDYISPEQAQGERATELSDLYSLGAVLYELLTGHVPFPAESAVAAAMRHASDPVPDVLDERPDVPVRLASAIARAMAKDPDRRFRSMDEFLAELVDCRREQPLAESAQTMILEARPRPVPPPSPPPSRRRRRRRAPIGLLVLLAAVLAAVAGGAYYIVDHRGHGTVIGGSRSASGAEVHLRAVASYDPPPGDGQERNDLLANATDGQAGTMWQTEHYTTAQFGNLKQGVGIVLDAGSDLKLGTITIQTPTAGFVAEVETAASASGPFTPVSSHETVQASTTFTLHVPGAQRYYLIWIIQLARFDTGDGSKPFGAKIAEVSAS